MLIPVFSSLSTSQTQYISASLSVSFFSRLIWFEVNVSHPSSSVNTPGFVCDCVNSGVLGQSVVSFSVMPHGKHNDVFAMWPKSKHDKLTEN